MVSIVEDCVILPKNRSPKKKKVITSLAVTNYDFPYQNDWIEVALSKKRCAVHLFFN